jgi:cytochrome c biogenesis protein CcdA
MGKMAVRVTSNIVILIGLYLLGRVLCNSFSAAAAQQYFGTSAVSGVPNFYALGLGLPIPLHVISVGLVLQMRWFSPWWTKFARWAIVISGCWLSLALGIRWLVL